MLSSTLRAVFLPICLWLACISAGAKPMTFVFEIPQITLNPYLREIWVDVVTPDGKTMHMPAFYAGGSLYAVRARPDQAGTYKAGPVFEMTAGRIVRVANYKNASPAEIANSADNAARCQGLAQIQIDPRNPRRFVTAANATNSSVPYFPLGSNAAWPTGHPPPVATQFYHDVFGKFSALRLNWMRLWMCHWSGMNLDWLSEEAGDSPMPGVLDPRVADTWDEIFDAAERNHVYVQLVLQHHGQYSTKTNSNWAGNPWNAANKNGFLKTPQEFFTLPDARYLTRLKYRYIVARWGYSPAIFAWELFNEVHWVDSMNTPEGRAAVATWHAEMAAAIRLFDVYRHLITTSNDDIRVDLTAKMDFQQVHCYARNMIDGVRTFDPCARAIPVFYGEAGDDHLDDDFSEKNSVTRLLPQIWASLFAEGEGLPAQNWYLNRFIDEKRLGELGAFARYVLRARLPERTGTVAFSPAVESAATMPLILTQGMGWHRQKMPRIDVPSDGSEPAALGRIPGILVGSPGSVADGFLDHVEFHFDLPAPVAARLSLGKIGSGGAAIRAVLDDETAKPLVEQVWSANGDGKETSASPGEFSFMIPAGRHVLMLRNTGGLDWVEFKSLTLDKPVSKIAVLGRRSDDFVALWAWHRENIYAHKAGAPASATILIADLPAGNWRVTWWDTVKGCEMTSPASAAVRVIAHAGGLLRLQTPPVARYCAAILERVDAK